MRKVRTNYDSLTQAELNNFIHIMVQALTGNMNFPNLPKPLNIISGKLSDWHKELALSQSGNKEATIRANEIQTELLKMVKLNGNYINDTANGDFGMLESSGYWLTKERAYNPRPMIKIVQDGHSGAGNVVIKAFPHAAAYLVEFCTDSITPPGNDAPWKRLKLSTKRTLPFEGLEPGRLYWARFTYVTVEGEAPYSQPVSFRVI
jgi:hypothetical protein